MNFKKLLLITGIVSFMSLGCDLLDKKPESQISSDNVIYNEKSAQNAISGLYRTLEGGVSEGNQKLGFYNGQYFIISDLMTDISQSIGTENDYEEADTYNTNIDNDAVTGTWTQAYKAISQANFIITKVLDLENIDEKVLNNILGQAYFIRAFCYFDLNRAFGGIKGIYGTKGVPIVLKPTSGIGKLGKPSRASISEVYAQVEADLKEAVNLLSGKTTTPTRASQAAAKALLSRLYLYYKQDYGLVEKYSTEVLKQYGFKLTENYANIFSDDESDGTIFELIFTSSDPNAIHNLYYPSSLGGRFEIALHLSFVKLLKSRPKDERADLIAFDEAANVYYPTKYPKPTGEDNIIALRLAEMYLNRAEARAQQGKLSDALSDLNMIRNRAGLPDTTGAGVDTADEILDAITFERSIEFFEEGHRWFDLIRTGRALDVLKDIKRKSSGAVSLIEPGRQVWPIPEREIDANENLEQNDAYK